MTCARYMSYPSNKLHSVKEKYAKTVDNDACYLKTLLHTLILSWKGTIFTPCETLGLALTFTPTLFPIVRTHPVECILYLQGSVKISIQN